MFLQYCFTLELFLLKNGESGCKKAIETGGFKTVKLLNFLFYHNIACKNVVCDEGLNIVYQNYSGDILTHFLKMFNAFFLEERRRFEDGCPRVRRPELQLGQNDLRLEDHCRGSLQTSR